MEAGGAAAVTVRVTGENAADGDLCAPPFVFIFIRLQ